MSLEKVALASHTVAELSPSR